MISHEIISVVCGGLGPILPPGSFDPTKLILVNNRSNSRTPCQCYQDAFLDACSLPRLIPEVLIYVHDDIEIFDPDWLPKVLAPFIERSECIAVGLGGATSLGRESLYKRPYRISDMARGGYTSGQRDWHVHGERLNGSSRVVVLDAFFMAVRTSFLDEMGGWPVDHLTFHCLDLWLSCEAARRGKETWIIPVDCMHYGGKTSTRDIYQKVNWLQGSNTVADHEKPHKWLWKEYRDALPLKVPNV